LLEDKLFLQAVIDYLREPSGGAMPAGGKVQDFQNPMRKDFHILGGATTSQRKGGMLDLYGGPKPGIPLAIISFSQERQP